MDPYEVLANAIIVQAVDDYRRALHYFNLRPNNEKYQARVEELEAFFYTSWFGTLTALDPDALIEKLRKEAKKEA